MNSIAKSVALEDRLDLRYYEAKEPLYVGIINYMLDKINSKEWSVGAKLPTEDQIQEQFGVSRGTVRRALSELESMEMITRRPGLGTFVGARTQRLPKALGEIVSFTQQLVDAGYTPDTQVLEQGIIKLSEAGGRVAEAFFAGDADIPQDAQVVHIKRLRRGNGIPFAIQSVYFLPDQTPDILEQDLLDLFQLYRERYNRDITSADETLQAAGASPAEAKLLKVKEGAPVMIRDRISFDQDEQPFEVLHSVDRGDRFTYNYQILSDRSRVPSRAIALSRLQFIVDDSAEGTLKEP